MHTSPQQPENDQRHINAPQTQKEPPRGAEVDYINIVEGNFNCNISFIGDYVRQYIRKNGSRPVVFIDYLQILQPASDTKSTKEAVDYSLAEVKTNKRRIL